MTEVWGLSYIIHYYNKLLIKYNLRSTVQLESLNVKYKNVHLYYMSIYKLSIYNTLKPNQLKQVKFQLLKKNEPYQIAELENISIVKCLSNNN